MEVQWLELSPHSKKVTGLPLSISEEYAFFFPVHFLWVLWFSPTDHKCAFIVVDERVIYCLPVMDLRPVRGPVLPLTQWPLEKGTYSQTTRKEKVGRKK